MENSINRVGVIGEIVLGKGEGEIKGRGEGLEYGFFGPSIQGEDSL